MPNYVFTDKIISIIRYEFSTNETYKYTIMEKYFNLLILLGIIYYQIDQSHCQNLTTEIITDICGSGLYQCKKGGCINETLICDGKRHCQDGDDEENCIAARKNSTFFCAKTNRRCTCEDERHSSGNILSLNCTNAELFSFPKLINKNSIKNIFLKGNKIQKLTAGIINGSNHLESLVLPHNAIETIENNTFSNATEDLKHLDLSDNNLKRLIPGMFEHLPILLYFSLARNQISMIDRDALKDIQVMGELDLSGNKLKKLTPGIFNRVDDHNNIITILITKSLNLESNEISVIEPNTFNGIGELGFLNLASNNITRLSSEMFKGLNVLTLLHLGDNKIDTIEDFTFDLFSIITSLNLSRNKIKKLTPGMFNATRLELIGIDSLNLRGNEITTIESDTFRRIGGLEFLDLSHNNLTNLSLHIFENLTALKVLLLSENKISRINASTFNKLPKLEVLKLTGNPLHDVDAGLFSNTQQPIAVTVDNITMCCKMKNIKCNSPTGSPDYCEQSMNTNNSMWYWCAGIGLFSVIIVLIFVIKAKFSGPIYKAPLSNEEVHV